MKKLIPKNQKVKILFLPKSLKANILDLLKIKPRTFNIEKTISNTQQEIINYYNSPAYKDKLIKSGIINENEINDIINLKINNINNTSINYTFDPTRNSFGWTNLKRDGTPVVYVNTAKADTEELVKETMYHELGGHASTNSYSHQPEIIAFKALNPEIFKDPIYERIYQNNYSLMPKLKDSWKAFKNNDMLLFNQLADNNDKELLKSVGEKSIHNFLNYLSAEQETSARAIADNIGDWTGNPSSWNRQQLFNFFTPESIDKLKKGVFGLIGSNLIIQSEDSDLNNK